MERARREQEIEAPRARGRGVAPPCSLRRFAAAISSGCASRFPSCAASFTPIWARGSAPNWRAIRSVPTRSISFACSSPISRELHGDRSFGDDPAIVAGFARFHGRPVLVLGHQKGRDTKQRVARNFGQAKPEGYRKALRLMHLAAKFGRPIFTFVDTPGAYPGIDAEERGQAEAIAHNLREMSRLPVPIIVTITGEGGSGGALAIAVGDQINMLENRHLLGDFPGRLRLDPVAGRRQGRDRSQALHITANDLSELGIVDEIVPEPEGGAHLDHEATAHLLDPVLVRALDSLSGLAVPDLLHRRYEKFRRMGQFLEVAVR